MCVCVSIIYAPYLLITKDMYQCFEQVFPTGIMISNMSPHIVEIKYFPYIKVNEGELYSSYCSQNLFSLYMHKGPHFPSFTNTELRTNNCWIYSGNSKWLLLLL